MEPELEELAEQRTGSVPGPVRWAAAFLLGALLMVLIVGTTSLFGPDDPDAVRLYESGFADGLRIGAEELAAEVDQAQAGGYLEGLRASAANAGVEQSLRAWLRSSVLQVDAQIVAAGTASADFEAGYRDGLGDAAETRAGG